MRDSAPLSAGKNRPYGLSSRWLEFCFFFWFTVSASTVFSSAQKSRVQ